MPTSDASISAPALRQARLDAGYTQESAAQALDLHPMRLSVWERGVAEPRPVIVPRLAALYKVPVADLLTDHVRGTLRAARLARGLTVHEVAQQTGISGSWYHHLERFGTSTDLDPTTLDALADCLRLTAPQIVHLVRK